MKWITGPALETVLALRGLKVGDLVKLKPCDERCAADPDNCPNTHYGLVAKDILTRPIVGFVESDERYAHGGDEPDGVMIRTTPSTTSPRMRSLPGDRRR